MPSLLHELGAAGITFTALPNGGLKALGPLTDEVRAMIREHKATILAELSAANDDRRPCTACLNLSPGGRCLAAWRGARIGNAGHQYSPVPDISRRCEGYTPTAADPDRRTGAQRWPTLVVAARVLH